MQTPKQQGYYFPAEFAKHDATWLSYIRKHLGRKIDTIYPYYCEFIKYLALSERVCINVNNEAMKQFALGHLQKANVDLTKVEFFMHPTNDAWCRDHGPAFLLHKTEQKKQL
jgi:agmatine deiminase